MYDITVFEEDPDFWDDEENAEEEKVEEDAAGAGEDEEGLLDALAAGAGGPSISSCPLRIGCVAHGLNNCCSAAEREDKARDGEYSVTPRLLVG